MCSRWKFEICWRVSMSNMTKCTFESELTAPWELFIKYCSSLVIKNCPQGIFAFKILYIKLPNWLSEFGCTSCMECSCQEQGNTICKN